MVELVDIILRCMVSKASPVAILCQRRSLTEQCPPEILARFNAINLMRPDLGG
jgi:hypothetical protein